MIQIKIENEASVFTPGDQINGVVHWSDLTGDSLEVRLIWFTIGKGDRDFELVATHRVVSYGPSGSERFQFEAPRRPQSFSGKLISLQWAIEAIVFPDQDAARVDLVISNSGQEINIAESSE
ncbi:hypothetical protein [Mariniblastus fucicola]|uniref:Arrestin-like N-terminal domain-containing protein n=1 Tax=Mariniblastus fucicola TaxID=980251 RepID=A0A5B9PGJ3_9BACT|nr:hypothetical protein [Mariniblastus fucicola]QEG23882.1 hypothetical protein MFFC18_37860 [Mariniblastus fucicola]